MKKSFSTIILVLVIMFNYSLSVYGNEEKTVENLKVEATSAILMDFETGRVLWEKNANAPLAMASTTKIMTAIVALENGKLNSKVVVSSKAAAAPKVKMNLQKGEEISLEALLYALMMQSSNDAAVAIAEHVGGSVEDFCKIMTDKAIELGCTNTIFETPNGLDKGDHHSTAYDLALITRYALNNKKFMSITNTKTITISSNKTTYAISNKNRLLSEFSGANGVKTGFTGKAGQCFVGAAKRGDMQLISVVLASGWGDKGKEQKWVDSKRILETGFKNFEYATIIEEKTEAATTNVLRARELEIASFYADSLKIPLSKDEKESLKVIIQMDKSVNAPIAIGDKIGKAQVIIKDKVYKEIDLLAKDNIKRFDLKTCFEDVLNKFIGLSTKAETNIVLPEMTQLEQLIPNIKLK